MKNKIQNSWNVNALRWIDAIDKSKIESRRFTNAAIVFRASVARSILTKFVHPNLRCGQWRHYPWRKKIATEARS